MGPERRFLRGLDADELGLAEELGGSLLGELFLRGSEEVLVFVEAARGAHPCPVAGEAKLSAAMALTSVGGGVGRERGRSGAGASELLALGADLRGGFGEGAGAEVGLDVEGPFEEGAEGAHLAAGGAAGALGAGVGVPGAGEGGDGGAGAVSVRGEHRADASGSGIDVGADDDAVGLDAAEHRFLGVLREALDGNAEVVCGPVATCSHAERCSGVGVDSRG